MRARSGPVCFALGLTTPFAALLSSACGETTVAIVDAETAPEPVDLALELLAYLPLDEAEAGAQALDVSGHEHHGTPSATPPTPSDSVPPVAFPNPKSLDFSGTEQFLDLGNPPELDVEGDLTLCAW